MSADIKEQIANTAFRLFLENGYNATSIRAIAQECDMTHVNVLYHFKSKLELGILLAKQYILELKSCTFEILNSCSTKTDLNDFCFFWMVHFSFMQCRPEFARFYCELFDASKEEMSHLMQDITRNQLGQDFIGISMDTSDPEKRLYYDLLVEVDLHLVRMLVNEQTSLHQVTKCMFRYIFQMLLNKPLDPVAAEEMVAQAIAYGNSVPDTFVRLNSIIPPLQ